MINKFELARKAKEYGLQSSTIEKDYVLGWILIGIQHHPQTRETWVFKGGTCLKKCFFNKYRFSEDLDFTLLDSQQMQEEALRPILKEIAQWIYEQSGIEIPENLISLDPHRSLSVQGKLSYRGPLKQPVPYPSIKLDLTANEQVVLKPEKRKVFHEYSDCPIEMPQILSYSYEEIFAEKLRALAERARPRDLYDVVHLYQERHRLTDIEKLLESLQGKCAFKKMPMPNLVTIEQHPQKSEFLSEWKNMLHHQVKDLRPFEYFWEHLPDIFSWIYHSKK
jgi:predicted nucleotidyltransferase component of viral defense system